MDRRNSSDQGRNAGPELKTESKRELQRVEQDHQKEVNALKRKISDCMKMEQEMQTIISDQHALQSEKDKHMQKILLQKDDDHAQEVAALKDEMMRLSLVTRHANSASVRPEEHQQATTEKMRAEMAQMMHRNEEAKTKAAELVCEFKKVLDEKDDMREIQKNLVRHIDSLKAKNEQCGVREHEYRNKIEELRVQLAQASVMEDRMWTGDVGAAGSQLHFGKSKKRDTTKQILDKLKKVRNAKSFIYMSKRTFQVPSSASSSSTEDLFGIS